MQASVSLTPPNPHRSLTSKNSNKKQMQGMHRQGNRLLLTTHPRVVHAHYLSDQKSEASAYAHPFCVVACKVKKACVHLSAQNPPLHVAVQVGLRLGRRESAMTQGQSARLTHTHSSQLTHVSRR